MKIWVLFVLWFIPVIGKCQPDSTYLSRKNTISIEYGGGSYSFLGFGNPFNYGFHRKVVLHKKDLISLGCRLGVTYDKVGYGNVSKILWEFPIEANLMFGTKRVKPEFGMSYTPVFGEQRWPSDTSYFSEFYTLRVGFQVRFYFLYLRSSWCPTFVPKRYPIPEDELNRNNWKLFRASLTAGITF